MFLQQQASPVIHTVGGSGGGGGRGEGEGGERGREGEGRGRGRGESTLHDTKDQWSKLLPTFSVAHYVSKTLGRRL